MADKYVDYALSTGSNDGSDWTNAYHTTTPTQNGLTNAGAGGNVFIKTDSAGSNTDLTAADTTYTSPGTVHAHTNVYGCKNGTTNTPLLLPIWLRLVMPTCPSSAGLVTIMAQHLQVFGISSGVIFQPVND